MSTLLFSIFIFVRVSSITKVGWNLGDYNRICEEKSTLNIERIRKNKNQQGNENLVNQMQQEINEVNFLFWFYCIKVNVLMTFFETEVNSENNGTTQKIMIKPKLGRWVLKVSKHRWLGLVMVIMVEKFWIV